MQECGKLYRDLMLKLKGIIEKINEKFYLGSLSNSMMLKKKIGKTENFEIQEIIKFTKLKDRYGNRVGFCEHAENIADYLHHVQWSLAPVPPAK